jgi:hypothetical protein
LIILRHHVYWWLIIGFSIWIILYSIPNFLPESTLLSLKCHSDTVAALVVEILQSFKFGRNLEPLLTLKVKNILDLILLVNIHGRGNSERSIIAELSLQFTTVFDHNADFVVVDLAIEALWVESFESKHKLVI